MKQIFKNPPLRGGLTTGACAQAAAKACALMLIQRKIIEKIEIELPNREKKEIFLIDPKLKPDYAQCGVIKDAGDDDTDVTHGMEIYCRIRRIKEKGIILQGGPGIGKVTKPGLALPVGDYAINPVPRRMILKEITALIPRSEGIEVTIYAPRGEEIASQTYNPKVGIAGGISIIGTTGLVKPKSHRAYQRALQVELRVAAASGIKTLYLASGYVGEKIVKETFGVEEEAIIKIGDHVGFMLKECVKNHIESVILIGHIGKMVKVAAGLFNTHSHTGDARLETIAAYAAASGAPKELVNELLHLNLAEAAIEPIRRHHLMEVFDRIAQRVAERGSDYCAGRLKPGCILLSLKGEVIGTFPKELNLYPKKIPHPKVYIIGAGPGAENLLTPLAREKIKEADIIIGAPRLLALHAGSHKTTIPLRGDYSEVLEYIHHNKADHPIALLVSGDPGLFSLGHRLTGSLKAGEYEVVPGISSLQVACARVGESWNDMHIISLHGRDITGLEQTVKDYRKVFLFCDPENTPSSIASYLAQKGISNRMCFALKNLSLPDEEIIRADINTLRTMDHEWTGLWVMMIIKK